MTESPRHLVAIAFHIGLFVGCGTDDSCDVSAHAGFLSYANYHCFSLLRNAKIHVLIIMTKAHLYLLDKITAADELLISTDTALVRAF